MPVEKSPSTAGPRRALDHSGSRGGLVKETKAYARPLSRAAVLSRMAADIFIGLRSLRDRLVLHLGAGTRPPMTPSNRARNADLGAAATSLETSSKHAGWLQNACLAGVKDMDKGFKNAPVDSRFNLTAQTVRDMQGCEYLLKVNDGPEHLVKVVPGSAKKALQMRDNKPDSLPTEVSSDLGKALGVANPELLKKALYFTTQEVIAVFEEQLTQKEESPLVKEFGGKFNFTGSPTLSHGVTVVGDVATVAIDYRRARVENVFDAASLDLIDMEPEKTSLTLKCKFQIELGRATQFVPGSMELAFGLARTKPIV